MNQDNQREAVLYAYLAGIIDGEGTIRIAKSHFKGNKNINPIYSGAISVGMTEKVIIDLFAKTFGAKTRIERVPVGRKPVYRWGTAGKFSVPKIIDKLLPYLIVKKEQALLVKEFCETKKAPFDRGAGLSQKELQWREDFYLKVRKLNAVGAPATTNRKDA